jgi:hypothetical protein
MTRSDASPSASALPKVRLDLASAEQQDLQMGCDDRDVHPQVSRSAWIMTGIELEDQQ